MIDNLTVIVPFYNGHEYLGDLLSSLPGNLPVIVVDDLSKKHLHLERENVRVVRLEEKGYFTGACNFGISLCETDVLILNQDVEFTDYRSFELIADLRDRFALIGEGIKGKHPAFPNGYVHGVFQFMRRDAIKQVGVMDQQNYPLWGASALWQWQITRKGFSSKPLDEVPGMVHKRGEDKFGSSIRSIVTKDNSRLLIRTPPAISVIIPSYNHGKYLEDAINSLIGGNTSLGYTPGQTFQSFEIIIVDDGSTDNTPEVCKQLCDEWKGIRYIRQKNAGTAAAHNMGIRMAVGKYVTTMSADDMREPWALEEMYRAIEEDNRRLVYDGVRRFANGQKYENWPLRRYDFDELLTKNMVPVGTMFTKKAWKDVGGYPEALKYGREDWGFAIAMGMHGYCGYKLESSGYLYRRENQNRSLRNTTPDWRQRFLAQMVELFPDLYRGKRPMACCGGRNKGANPQVAAPELIPGAVEGWTVLEYVGNNVGTVTWGGPGVTPSSRVYKFGNNPRNKKAFVDNQDVPYFLKLRDRQTRTDIFAVVKPAPAPEQIKIVEQQEALVEPEVIDEPEMYDLKSMTVYQIKKLEFDSDSAKLHLEVEKSGKNRKSVIAFLEDTINA